MQAGCPKGRPLRKPLVGGGACSDPRDIADIQEATPRGASLRSLDGLLRQNLPAAVVILRRI